MHYLPNEEFKELAKKLKDSNSFIELTPKELLVKYFGVTRRKTHVVWCVDKALKEHGLITVPNYKVVWQHEKIKLTSKNEEESESKGSDSQEEHSTVEVEKSIQDGNIPLIRVLKASNKPPTFVTKNDTLTKAITLMMENDYSQLPVMNSATARDVDGIISWHSIGWKTSLGHNGDKVKDFLTKEFTTITNDKPLLDAVEIIKARRVVLIRKEDRSISGLVTIADIVEEFHKLAEPFFIVGEIEASLREIIGDKFTPEELKEVKYGDDDREVLSVSNLSFNEYIQLIRKGDNWSRLNLPLDKSVFTERLEKVRDIRNDIMHFNADDIDDEQKEILRKTSLFLREILG